MSVDILGRFYEEYLRLKPKQKTAISKKTDPLYLFEQPTHSFDDIRRSKGIFYTPRFIVHHIVSNLIRRHEASHADRYPYDPDTEKVMSWTRLRKEFPRCGAYLEAHKPLLASRKSLKGESWYELIRPRTAAVFDEGARLFIAELSLRPVISMSDSNERIAIAGSTGGGSWILLKNSRYEDKSLMAFLNSSIVEWFLRQVASVRRGGWMVIEQHVLETILIPKFLSEPQSFARSELNRLAERAKELMKTSANFQSSESRRQIATIEEQIDTLLIEALGLNAQEGSYIRKRVLALRGARADRENVIALF